MLKSYLGRILEASRHGDAREESYYSALEGLLLEFASSAEKKDVHVTVLPKKTDAGNPDFRIWDGQRKIVGYIEAKTPDTNLDDVQKTEQIKRYITTFPNFILTNFFEFRLYKNGSCVNKVRIADPIAVHTLRGIPIVGADNEFQNLLEKFFSFSLPSITSTDVLAVELAKRTRFLRDEVIAEEIREEERSGLKRILGFYEAFQKYLIKGLTKEQFADLYSQTITYGLFASRMRCEGEFNRKVAVYDIPHTIGILREMFEFISLGDLPHQLEWIVDEISDVLANVNVQRIFLEYLKTKRGGDPVFPFYETFLAEYDPEQRERRGVYYTPEPVVSYIVRSLHLILKGKFFLNDGLADKDVTILDPAGGTLTFLAEAVREAAREFTAKYGDGGKEDFIKEHILSDFYAFELLIAPYAIGHLKMSFLLEELGHRLQEKERIKFYLTNTLEMEEIEQTSLPGMVSLSEESHLAGLVKKKTPILIILGNPPYSGISTNIGAWISKEIREYYTVDGEALGERNPKWLQDDYVKFFRFAEWKIEQAGKGVIGFITNHSYLDNVTFRGMRQHLMKSFDEIYILDLHGSSNETCPDGSKDENVFDITKGVAIAFFVKRKSNHKRKCKVFSSELWGSRKKKYDILSSSDIKNTRWKEIHPSTPFYLYTQVKEKITKSYGHFWKITDIFPVSSVGVVTARDKFVIDFDENTLKDRIATFRDPTISDIDIKTTLELREKRGWKVEEVRKRFRQDVDWEKHFYEILFRPFDKRFVYYHPLLIERTRSRVMQHMMHENVAMISARSNKSSSMNHFFCSQYIIETKCGERTTQSYIFPLFLYQENQRKPNLNIKLLNLLNKAYNSQVTPDDVFNYMYSIFYSNRYRNKYMQNLRIDFPRVPFTSEYDLFLKMTKLGRQLVDLHIMKSEELSDPATRFQGVGDNFVEKPTFNEERKRVYINRTQFFESIEKEVWEYEIGGYQVLSKWLKERDGRSLALEEIRHYCRVATAIKKTMELQREIDELFADAEKDIIDFKKDSPDTDLKRYASSNDNN
jgi:hypothetical protein